MITQKHGMTRHPCATSTLAFAAFVAFGHLTSSDADARTWRLLRCHFRRQVTSVEHHSTPLDFKETESDSVLSELELPTGTFLETQYDPLLISAVWPNIVELVARELADEQPTAEAVNWLPYHLQWTNAPFLPKKLKLVFDESLSPTTKRFLRKRFGFTESNFGRLPPAAGQAPAFLIDQLKDRYRLAGPAERVSALRADIGQMLERNGRLQGAAKKAKGYLHVISRTPPTDPAVADVFTAWQLASEPVPGKLVYWRVHVSIKTFDNAIDITPHIVFGIRHSSDSTIYRVGDASGHLLPRDAVIPRGHHSPLEDLHLLLSEQLFYLVMR